MHRLSYDGPPPHVDDCAGFCARCDAPVYADDDGSVQLVDGKPVCDDCMTLDDWDIVDPEFAAELRDRGE